MEVRLRFQSTGAIPGRGEPLRLSGGAITIGRAQDNDYALPDPDRLLSKRHCAIERHGNAVVVVDFSTNGTFLNYGKVPIGRVPTELSDGDILSIGPYELLVEIAEVAREAPATVAGTAAAHDDADTSFDDPLGEDEGDFLEELLGGASRPTGAAGVNRPELGEDGLLPPLDADDEAARDVDEPVPSGPTPSQHAPAVEDYIPSPRAAPQAIPEDWDDEFLTGIGAPDAAAGPEPEAEPPAPPPRETPPRPEPPPSQEARAPEPAAPPPPSATDTATEAELLRAFLRGAGLDDLEIPPEARAETMERAGRVMRVMVNGLREVLMTRTSIKSEFRIAQTMIAAGDNNPLKFSISEEQAMESLIRPRSRGYLDPVAAAEEALRDVKAHEVAVLSGMEAALRGILRGLSPQELEGRIETSGGLGALLKGRKARYWEVYEKMYAEIADQAETDFQELFGKEFARAYEEQQRKLK
ncbi:type VI secretion system-associated FHA domain protein TagH [Rhodosalinus halophilus]|uniref:Type VI secretion system-associated FHA domain protein TagH n=1 Tax=Rhodosalinus halophilus TaxID=2259333 RepID=A0A365UDM5_9RHOB|nr:type VI secretion system-associated FHA domain protein TagH [Rhodosalinus halophilus]RBI87377.1 type VI secretion system-associated FHA domain protein TagH [Rhodosalinus halophilus]